MSNTVKLLIVGAIALVVLIGIPSCMGISYSNREIRLRNQIATQQESCKIIYDETWKVISQKAQVAEKYKDAFKEIFPALMEGRYGNARGGALLSFVQESNPNFDIGLYRDLSNAIEAKRAAFSREQKTLIDLKREHDNLRQMFPSSIFVGGRKECEVQIVTSGKTKETFATGEENDVNVFGD